MVSSASEAAMKKRVDELVKELAARTIELAGLKLKIRQFADYDEIKRELEIMKVSPHVFTLIA